MADPSDLDRALLHLVTESARFLHDARTLPLTPAARPDLHRARLAAHFDFDVPRDLDALLPELRAMLVAGTLHAAHPRHFGLFQPRVDAGSVGAEALVALINPQLSVWGAAPAAVEIEQHTLRALAARLGFAPASVHATFTTGGAEANLTAGLLALAHRWPATVREGVWSLPGRPALYVSEEGHATVLRAAQVMGLGRDAVRTIRCDAKWRIDVGALRRRIAEDRAAGAIPWMVCAMAGSTSAGAIDPLDRLADLCAEESLWLHVDAAWGGIAALSPTLRPALDGVARADSVTWDAHKGLHVPLGAGMLFCRHRALARDVFAVREHAAYMPSDGDLDRAQPHAETLQWSRRAMGLKVFVTLARHGWAGLAAQTDHLAAMAERLREGLRARGWQTLEATPLPVVCATHPLIRRGAVAPAKLAQRLRRDGVAWVSDTRLGGRVPAIRACVTNTATEPGDIDALVEGLHRALG